MCNGKKGQIIMALLIIIILPMFIIILTNLLTMENKQTVKHKKSTVAFHLAEAAIDRGVWKLSESDDVWNAAVNGETISGYDGNTPYSDLSGGQYKIIFSSGPGINDVTIIGKASDISASEVRTIKTVYQKTQITAAISAGEGVEFKSGLIVHWAPVVSGREMELKGQAKFRYYPRKYAIGKIKERDETAEQPNTDNLEYWAYNSGKIGELPEINFNYYKEKAKASTAPEPKKGTADPEGSGYFTGKVEFKDYVIKDPDTIIYIEGDVKMDGDSFFDMEAMIIRGNIHMHSKGEEFEATIPSGANLEYQHPDAQEVWEDEFEGKSTYEVDDCAFHGFLYADSFKCSGGTNSFVGILLVKGDVGINTLTFYYDSEVAGYIKSMGASIERTSWKEVVAQW